MADDYSVLVGEHRIEGEDFLEDHEEGMEDGESWMYLVQDVENDDVGLYSTVENAGEQVGIFLGGDGREQVVNASDVDVDTIYGPDNSLEWDVQGVSEEEYDDILSEAGL